MHPVGAAHIAAAGGAAIAERLAQLAARAAAAVQAVGTRAGIGDEQAQQRARSREHHPQRCAVGAANFCSYLRGRASDLPPAVSVSS